MGTARLKLSSVLDLVKAWFILIISSHYYITLYQESGNVSGWLWGRSAYVPRRGPLPPGYPPRGVGDRPGSCASEGSSILTSILCWIPIQFIQRQCLLFDLWRKRLLELSHFDALFCRHLNKLKLALEDHSVKEAKILEIASQWRLDCDLARNIFNKARQSTPLTVRSSWFEGFSL